MNMPEPRILLVDDDPSTRMLFDGLLRRRARLSCVDCLEDARRAFLGDDFQLVLLDQRLPDGLGLDFFREIRAARPRQVVILITGYADVKDAMAAVRMGLFEYLTKPFESLESLLAVIDRGLALDRAEREAAATAPAESLAGPQAFVGAHSAALLHLNHEVREVANLPTSVLIEGESGTGKDVYARRLHELGERAKHRLVAVNCGALTETLLEATLFGYERGAFTGAMRAAEGCFEAADGGTLFLDEIADMSPKLQASLLRVLQDRTFCRLGSTQPRRSDFRLVCATNRSLEDAVRAGQFRADLFYRLNVIKLRIPPLRERRADILPLAMHFLDEFNAAFGKAVGPLTDEAAAWLENAPWPGNVRELRHAIERLVAIKRDGPVHAADLSLSPAAIQGASTDVESLLAQSFRHAREDFERRYFTALLRRTAGNVAEAARQSGLARQNVYEHLRRLGAAPSADVS